MKIYSMTATFGKLEHETLTLEPGLNIITAPNEWGKSTWCAFLVAMLYGLDTRAKSTKTALADKERFAPWSGAPMAGRMDLSWNGRDITIERSTRRRVPLGEFRAYETETGVPVEELTAANCGQMLLGVEQSVFRRAGFIRQAELPVTPDEALRRRLNALVTTGDESGAADKLAYSLKELKNRCRYNRSGLLPQAEQERAALEGKLRELSDLDRQSQDIRLRLEDLKEDLAKLYNHRQTLAYQQVQTLSAQAAQAQAAKEAAQRELEPLEQAVAALPSREEAEKNLRELRSFRDQWRSVQQELSMQPTLPTAPQWEAPFAGMEPEAARAMAEADGKTFRSLKKSKLPLLLLLMGVLGMISAGALTALEVYPFAAVAGVTALIALAGGVFEKISMRNQCRDLVKKYGSADAAHWADPIAAYEQERTAYEEDLRTFNQSRADVDMRLMLLHRRKESLCGQQDPDALVEYWNRVLSQWDACATARREADRADSHCQAIRSMLRPVEKPAMEDGLTCSEAETARRLADCAAEQQRLQNRLGQHQGRMALLGDREKLTQELERKNRRIARLEDTYAALTLAQETLEEARTELQRRFAPRITKKAQAMLETMTAGRYQSLTMGADFTLQAGAAQEDVLHDALWRSDGTLDQLYLALRLAVAQELTPQAPVVLDDAMVRFDDDRLAAALTLLADLAQEKQVLCFTCQGREAAIVKKKTP
ncbi:MAG: AAA family ATPase [Eubacteriales bacterium]|nr:AAA family ATPase [Eubacteriales bacterium]